MFGFTGCSDDHDETVYHAPTTFEMNEPVLADQYLDLNDGGTYTLTAKAQPDYGYSAITQYTAIASLTPDFTESIELKNINATQSYMTFSCDALALAICQLQGIETEDDWAEKVTGEPITKVYFRGVAEIAGVEGSRIESSNVVSLNNVRYYFAVPTPGYIYLVGSFTGWTEPKADNAAQYKNWRLFEPANAIGSEVYSGVFDIPAGEIAFRIYTDLEGWAKNSWGPNTDAGVEKEEDNDAFRVIFDWNFQEAFNLNIEQCKNNFVFKGWEGGKMTFTVDMKNKVITIMPGEHSVTVTKYVYMIGNNGKWAPPTPENAAIYDPWRLADDNEDGIYEGRFDMTGFTEAGGTLYCRFYQELAGWGAAQWAGDIKDGDNVDVILDRTMPTVVGEGNFVVADAADKIVLITLDTNANTVLFSFE